MLSLATHRGQRPPRCGKRIARNHNSRRHIAYLIKSDKADERQLHREQAAARKMAETYLNPRFPPGAIDAICREHGLDAAREAQITKELASFDAAFEDLYST